MIRQGNTDNVLGFLANTDVLRIKDNVGNQSWEGQFFGGRLVGLPFPLLLFKGVMVGPGRRVDGTVS